MNGVLVKHTEVTRCGLPDSRTFFRLFCRGRRPRRPDLLHPTWSYISEVCFNPSHFHSRGRYSTKHTDICKIPTPFDKIIFIIFFLFYWNLPPSPYPLPQGEGFKTFGRGRRRCEAHRVLRGADVPRAMVKNTHSAFLPWMGRFRTCPYVMF